MSRPQKLHKPIKASFNNILSAVGMGSGKGKRAAQTLAREKTACKPIAPPKPKKG